MSQPKPSSGLAAELGKRAPFSSLRQEAYLNLIRTHEQLATEFAQLFKEHGISDSQYNVLRILNDENRPMQIYEIAERLVYAQADISRLIKRVHASGLVTRECCSKDRRVVWIRLTDKARKLLKKMKRPITKLHESQFRDLNDSELNLLNELLFRARRSASSMRP